MTWHGDEGRRDYATEFHIYIKGLQMALNYIVKKKVALRKFVNYVDDFTGQVLYLLNWSI